MLFKLRSTSIKIKTNLFKTTISPKKLELSSLLKEDNIAPKFT